MKRLKSTWLLCIFMALAGSATGTTKQGQKPGALTATRGDMQVTLTWKASDGALSYNVNRGTASNGQSDAPVATGIKKLTYVDTGLTNGTTYYYKVRALTATGLGEPSNQAGAKPEMAETRCSFPGRPPKD